MVVFLTDIIPPVVRTMGFSLAYSLATAIFGGFTPAICTYLIHLTSNKAMPGVWLSFAALCALVSAGFLSGSRAQGLTTADGDTEERREISEVATSNLGVHG
jgi:hypothetical protein